MIFQNYPILFSANFLFRVQLCMFQQIMKIFIDIANVDGIKDAAEHGFISGVTTNPTLIAREKKI